MPYNEAPVSINFKPSKDYDAPQITVRAENPAELSQKLAELEAAGVYALAGNAHQLFRAAYELSNQLDAQHMATTQPMPDFAQPQQQAQTPVPPQPQQQFQPAQTPQAPQWGQQQPQYAPAGQAPQQYAQPTPGNVPPPQAPPQGSIPGAPLIAGIPAKFIDKGSWKAFADPRPKQFTDAIPDSNKTDDPTHPGLAAGTHKFWKFIRN